MSELTKYMKALATERKKAAEDVYALEEAMINYHQWFEDLAASAGVDIENDSWWDQSQEKQFDILKNKIAALRALTEPLVSINFAL